MSIFKDSRYVALEQRIKRLETHALDWSDLEAAALRAISREEVVAELVNRLNSLQLRPGK